MYIDRKGYEFLCPTCNTQGVANVTADFHCIKCNGNKEIYIICPICNRNIKVDENEIPKYIKPYITTQHHGYIL